VTHLLLPVPSFDDRGNVKGGGEPEKILERLPGSVTIVGGNIPENRFPGHRVVDLLKDPTYLAANASITAYCALGLAMAELPVVLRGCKTLILGWGRIGRCLAALLWALEADVTIGARKETDRAMLRALGFSAVDTQDLGMATDEYRIIFNTVPAPVMHSTGNAKCVKIDLASQQGIAGNNVIRALGLPGKDAPESSGLLITDTIMRVVFGKETFS
jgi:dipicolinate synthase subunit A